MDFFQQLILAGICMKSLPKMKKRFAAPNEAGSCSHSHKNDETVTCSNAPDKASKHPYVPDKAGICSNAPNVATKHPHEHDKAGTCSHRRYEASSARQCDSIDGKIRKKMFN